MGTTAPLPLPLPAAAQGPAANGQESIRAWTVIVKGHGAVPLATKQRTPKEATVDLRIEEMMELPGPQADAFPTSPAPPGDTESPTRPTPKAPTVEEVDLASGPRTSPPDSAAHPRATYRLQLRNGVDLARVTSLVPYLARLGISHAYLSPILEAAPGSAHGYDVVDPEAVDDSLGGVGALGSLQRALSAQGLGIVFDLVPNHMAALPGENRWFTDVLTRGRRSPVAPFFDIDWSRPDPALKEKVVLPVLGGRYGDLLRPGSARICLSERGVELKIQEGVFPVAITALVETLAEMGREEGRVQASLAAELVADEGPGALRSLQSGAGRGLGGHSAPDDPQDELAFLAAHPRWLDRLLQRQHYQLANWRAGSRYLNYRRFFDVDTLIGLRMEEEQAYRAYHNFSLHLLAECPNSGLRVDHPDGLFDPLEYLRRLRADAGQRWIVVEKILARHERVPPSWPVDGTTGYDFSRLAGGLLINRDSEPALTQIYREFTEERRTFAEISSSSKAEVLRELFAAELESITRILMVLARSSAVGRDFGAHEIRECLVALAANLPVYRTYVRPGLAGQELAAATDPVRRAATAAGGTESGLDPQVLAFVRDVACGTWPGSDDLDVARRWQQLTGAVMAKGVEDTAFYRYNRLISLNEVGDDPSCFGVAVDEFHSAMLERQEQLFSSMSATSTHDSKRGEDVRCRLNLLTHWPSAWGRAVRRWHRLTQGYRSPGVDSNFEYFFYQTVFGAWPISEDRLLPALRKSVREAKVHTSWRSPRDGYEAAVLGFATAALRDPIFRADLERFVQRMTPDWTAMSLTLCLLKLTAPGVPDIYQGTELWDLSLVDPDNRRPVDFRLRSGLVEKLDGLTPRRAMLARASGLPKLWVTATALAVRRQLPACFGQAGTYRPLDIRGVGSGGYVAFARGGSVVTVAPIRPPSAARRHRAAAVTLPMGTWVNRFTGRSIEAGEVEILDLLGGFPVALLTREGSR